MKSSITSGKSYFQHIHELSQKHDHVKETALMSMARVRNSSRYDLEKFLGYIEDKILGDGQRFHGLLSSDKEEEIEEKIQELKSTINQSVDEEWLKYRKKVQDSKDS